MQNKWKVAVSTAIFYAFFDIAILLVSQLLGTFGYAVILVHIAISPVLWVSKWAGSNYFPGNVSIIIGAIFVFFLLGLLEGRFLFSRVKSDSNLVLIEIVGLVLTFSLAMVIGAILFGVTVQGGS